jgi:hypothetical protein
VVAQGRHGGLPLLIYYFKLNILFLKFVGFGKAIFDQILFFNTFGQHSLTFTNRPDKIQGRWMNQQYQPNQS